MRFDAANLPKLGTKSKCLGVREPGNADVDLDNEGNVKLNGRGMSVVSDWRLLPGFLVPPHLENEFNGASGRGLRVFVHGEGGFVEAAVAESLCLRHKTSSDTAGNVVPTASLPLAHFQAALQATRSGWFVAVLSATTKDISPQ
jgi:hypothetical protein